MHAWRNGFSRPRQRAVGHAALRRHGTNTVPLPFQWLSAVGLRFLRGLSRDFRPVS